MRAPGAVNGVFALECAMDELAYALKIDPLELRLINYAEVDPESGKPFSSKELRECYRLGAEKFGCGDPEIACTPPLSGIGFSLTPPGGAEVSQPLDPGRHRRFGGCALQVPR